MSVNFDWDTNKRRGILTGDYFDEIREYFSAENKSAKFARYRSRFIAARKYVITQTGRFDIGLYYEIRKFLMSNQYDVKLNQTEQFKAQILPTYNIPQVNDNLDLQLRDYQRTIVDVCLRIGRGVVVLATAGGKTLTIANLIQNIFDNSDNTRSFKCLIVVPDIGLVNQTFSDLNEYGTTFLHSRWSGSNKLNLTSNVIIANAGILQSSKSDINWIHDIDLLIVDEVHKLRRDNKINKILKHISTPHKFGFTGTLPEEKIDQWNIIGTIGPILFEKDSYQLRSEKYVTSVMVQILKINYTCEPERTYDRSPSARYRKEIEFITSSEYRNNVISSLCSNFDNNSLILVDYIEHGQTLYNSISSNCPDKKCYFIRGDVDVESRDDVKKLMERDNNIVVIAISKIFSTGINIKNLHYIVFAGGGKAKVKIVQSIGRGLRLHKDKDKLIIIDIADQLYYGYRHMNKRINLYKKEKIKYGIKKLTQGKETKKKEST
jgi:superfamily II DNA or RNA helicase